MWIRGWLAVQWYTPGSTSCTAQDSSAEHARGTPGRSPPASSARKRERPKRLAFSRSSAVSRRRPSKRSIAAASETALCCAKSTPVRPSSTVSAAPPTP